MAFGTTVLTIVLAISGYTESIGQQVVTQSPAAIAGIVISFSVVPAVIMVLSLLALARYRLRKKDIERAVEGSSASRRLRRDGVPESADDILGRLDELRAADAPTHGGHVLSYVYDSGLAELDELAARAVRAVQPVNGLDPTTFSSVATLEREVIEFVRGLVHGDQADGDQAVVGTVTTGGTESCLLAVKTARDTWLAARGLEPGAARPRLVAPITVHAAFQKAAHYFGLELDLVPVEQDGAVAAAAIADRLGDDVALVVVSAPSYPFAALDPVGEVAALCLERGDPAARRRVHRRARPPVLARRSRPGTSRCPASRA